MTLHAHSRNANNVSALATIEIKLLDVFIDQSNAMLGWSECREQWQRANWQVCPLAKQMEASFQTPEGDFEFWIDKNYVSHGPKFHLHGNRSRISRALTIEKEKAFSRVRRSAVMSE
jgi:hypothetical protein